jgi:hypothetical protein
MFENTKTQGPAGFLAAVTEQLAKLPSQLWRTGNDGFADIAAAMDALAVQLDCARVGLVQEAESRGVVAASPAPSSTDWLLANCFHLEPADAARQTGRQGQVRRTNLRILTFQCSRVGTALGCLHASTREVRHP